MNEGKKQGEKEKQGQKGPEERGPCWENIHRSKKVKRASIHSAFLRSQ